MQETLESRTGMRRGCDREAISALMEEELSPS